MDEGLSRAVVKVFVQLYREGLIYKDKRLVNWDPKFHTAISDLEVEQIETKGHLWHFRYPIEGRGGSRFIVVATTRPETMLGDTAVAVHPDDERYRDLVGKFAILPLVGRRIPIVADDYADPEQGSGAVKITPAHDFNDFEVGRRNDLDVINIFDADARINDQAPEAYRGLDRFEARKRIVADLDALGLLEKIDDHLHMVPHGDRSGVPVEPYLTDQWFADAPTLAKPCIEAVEKGDTRFVPEQFAKIYFQWMRNIQPWCISRQLWWGHQVPVWYGPDGETFVEESEDAAQAAADAHYGKPTALTARHRRARHLVLVGAVAVLDPGLARRNAGARALLSRQRPGHRRGHHLLLGRPDDDDGHALHARRRGQGPGALRRRLHPRPGPRREGPEIFQVQGQRRRPARPGERVRRRRAALHAGLAGGPGPRHQAGREPDRRLPQLRDQDLERRPLLRDERLRLRRRLRPGGQHQQRQPLDRQPGRAAREAGDGGDRGLPLQRRGPRALPVHLAQLLRLVRRVLQAADGLGRRRRAGRDPGDGAVGAAPGAVHAPPVHALPLGGAVAADRAGRRGADGDLRVADLSTLAWSIRRRTRSSAGWSS